MRNLSYTFTSSISNKLLARRNMVLQRNAHYQELRDKLAKARWENRRLRRQVAMLEAQQTMPLSIYVDLWAGLTEWEDAYGATPGMYAAKQWIKDRAQRPAVAQPPKERCNQ